ncbi:Maf family protein [Gynuella sunshinyii]|uniref:7-methyl-GTP pyrophosphatase n=1 Tax=Gynuella sunshinyii YC6258 TaxID=1445510 RepID=A0A0C5VLZ4_9GAMM|nr:Maf family nucleotide pyrophosphatase [Gynuella sunshinyii]AJQ95316.1 nucleotide-binding protein implicated in inhibition of septum formation [Gynuella sunshinyii YC6258]
MTNIILASTSSYRAELLKRINLAFIQAAPSCDETQLPGESPNHQALRLAEEKARSLASDYPDHLIIGSDQVATIDQIHPIGKPGNLTNAASQLRQQSGKTVFFYTGLCVLNSATGISYSDIVTTTVRFRHLSDAMIENYLNMEDPSQCAGSFMSESLGICLTENIHSDDPTSLIGLPMIRLVEFLGFENSNPLLLQSNA